MLAVILAFSAASFVAGWVTGVGGLDALPAPGTANNPVAPVAAPAEQTPAATGPAATTPAAQEPAAPAPAKDESYTYTVDSNHPVDLSYVDSKGETTRLEAVDAPWSVEVGTASWGADTRPTLMVHGAVDGDTIVRCEIADESGHVVASDKKETSSATVFCLRW